MDMTGANAQWITRPRTGSHLDCLASRCLIEHKITEEWNHIWAGDDHTSLGMKIVVEVPGTGNENDGTLEEDPYTVIKYRYKNFTEDEKKRYAGTTDNYTSAGIEERIDHHLKLADHGSTQPLERHQKEAIVATDACLISAALHKAADMHVKMHKVSRRPTKPHARLNIKEIATKYKDKIMWDRISELRSNSKKGQRPGKVLPAVLTSEGEIKYGKAQVREMYRNTTRWYPNMTSPTPSSIADSRRR